MRKFVGQWVALKSGGPPMLIVDMNGGIATVAWRCGRAVTELDLHVACLTALSATDAA